MTELTLEELAELERLSSEATPAPWHRELLELGRGGPMTLGIGSPTRAVCIVNGIVESPVGNRDVASIVVTRNNLPALIAMARELVRLRAERRWIPCSERLPEPDQFCCIWVVDRGFYAVFEDGKFVRVGQMYPYDASQITHWHPMAELPAPPVRGDE